MINQVAADHGLRIPVYPLRSKDPGLRSKDLQRKKKGQSLKYFLIKCQIFFWCALMLHCERNNVKSVQDPAACLISCKLIRLQKLVDQKKRLLTSINLNKIVAIACFNMKETQLSGSFIIYLICLVLIGKKVNGLFPRVKTKEM